MPNSRVLRHHPDPGRRGRSGRCSTRERRSYCCCCRQEQEHTQEDDHGQAEEVEQKLQQHHHKLETNSLHLKNHSIQLDIHIEYHSTQYHTIATFLFKG